MKEKTHRTGRNRGFTLAELLIVVSITTVLAAFGFVAVNSYQWSLKVTEMDDTARELFVAAQNHLTAAKADGTLDSFYKDGQMSDSSAVQITDWSVLTDYPTPETKESDQETGKHDFYYIVYTPDQGTDAFDHTLLGEILPFGTIDETVRTSESYVIEFDAKTASIYSVFYTDSSEGINKETYQRVRSTAYFRTDKTVRKDYNKDTERNIIGYYGGTLAGVFETGASLDVSLEIDNSNTLSATVTDHTWTKDNKSLLTLTVQGRQSGVKESFTFNLNGTNISSILARDLSAGTAGHTLDTANLRNAVTITKDDSGLTYQIVLDDITGSKTHFTDVLSDFTPGEDITITARVTAGTSKPATDAKTVNSLFDSIAQVKGSASDYTASIGNARQLQNLEPTVSNLAQNAAASKCNISSVEVNTDFSWKDLFTDTGNTAVHLYQDDSTADEGKYFSILNNRVSNFNGKGYILSDLSMQANGTNAGLFAEGGGTGNTKAVETLILQNVFLKNVTVDLSGTNGSAGALIGVAGSNTTIASCGVYADNSKDYLDDSKSLIQTGTGSAGGLIGTLNQNKTARIAKTADDAVAAADAETDNDVIYGSFAAVRVKSTANAGGLIGEVTSAYKDNSLVIRDSYSSGSVKDDGTKEYDTDNANIQGSAASGGLIGSLKGVLTIESSYSTASVSSDGGAGGLTGVQTAYVIYNNCYAAGAAVAANNGTAGSIIGSLSTGAQFNGTDNAVLIGPYLKWYDAAWDEYDPSKEATARTAGYSTSMPAVGNQADTVYAAVTEVQKGTAPFISNNASASAYHTDLGNAYPFKAVNRTQPYAGSDHPTALTHYGDWYSLEPGSIKVTKTITADSSTLTSIVNSIKLLVTQGTRSVTVELKNATLNNDGTYTYTMYLPAGTYTIHETGRMPSGVSTCTTSINSVSFDTNVTDTDLHTDITVAANTETAVAVTNTYTAGELRGTGFLYYEKLSTGGYDAHGYLDNQEVGSLTYASGVTATEAGYVLVIPHSWSKDDVWIAGFNRSGQSYSYLKDLTDDKYLSLNNSLRTALNISSDYDVYTVSAEKYASKHRYYYGDSQFSIYHSDYWNSETYKCYMNPLFADEVRQTWNSSYVFNIRTAQQLAWLADDTYTGPYTTAYFSLTLQQSLDIDCNYKAKTIDSLTVTYQSTKSTSGEWFTLNHLDRPFVSTIKNNGKLKDMVVNDIVIKKDDYKSAFVTTAGYYGNEAINNVTINHVEINCSVKGSYFGIISYVNNATINNLTVNDFQTKDKIKSSGHYGIIGSNDGGTINNLTVTDSVISADISSNKYGGVIGYSNSGTIKNVTVKDVTLSRQGGDENYAVLGGGSGTALSYVTVENLTSYGSGIIYSLSSANSVTITQCTITGSNIKNAGFAYSISDLYGLDHCSVESSSVGGAGLIQNATNITNLSDCHVSGSYLGGAGLIDTASSISSISNCYVENTFAIQGNTPSIGKSGFIETASYITSISNCHVSGNSMIGSAGFINSISNSGTISNCYVDSALAHPAGSRGTITGSGFIGTIKYLTSITNCYVNNAVINGSGFINLISKQNPAVIDSSVKNSTVALDGFVTTDSSGASFSNCRVVNSTVGYNGFIGTGVAGTTLTDCSVTSTSIGKNGFAGTNNGTITTCSVDGVNGSGTYYGVTIGGNGFVGTNTGTIYGSNVFDAVSIGNADDSLTNTGSGNGFVGVNSGKITSYSDNGTDVYSAVVTSGTICGNGFAGTNTGTISNTYIKLTDDTVVNGNTDPESELSHSLTIGRNGFAELNYSTVNYDTTDSGFISNSSVSIGGSIGLNGFVGTNGKSDKYSVTIQNCSVSALYDSDAQQTLSLTIGANGFADTNYGSILGCSVNDVVSIGNNGFINNNGKRRVNKTDYVAVIDSYTENQQTHQAAVSVLSTIGGNGFAGTNDGTISGASVTGSSAIVFDDQLTRVDNSLAISGDGFAGTNNATGVIKGSTVSNIISIDGSGFISDNKGTIASIRNGDNNFTVCSVKAGTINGNGFADTNSGTITGKSPSQLQTDYGTLAVDATTINGYGFAETNSGTLEYIDVTVSSPATDKTLKSNSGTISDTCLMNGSAFTVGARITGFSLGVFSMPAPEVTATPESTATPETTPTPSVTPTPSSTPEETPDPSASAEPESTPSESLSPSASASSTPEDGNAG